MRREESRQPEVEIYAMQNDEECDQRVYNLLGNMASCLAESLLQYCDVDTKEERERDIRFKQVVWRGTFFSNSKNRDNAKKKVEGKKVRARKGTNTALSEYVVNGD
jgi:hypothetical protein